MTSDTGNFSETAVTLAQSQQILFVVGGAQRQAPATSRAKCPEDRRGILLIDHSSCQAYSAVLIREPKPELCLIRQKRER